MGEIYGKETIFDLRRVQILMQLNFYGTSINSTFLQL
jgi:hypothetical protein